MSPVIMKESSADAIMTVVSAGCEHLMYSRRKNHQGYLEYSETHSQKEGPNLVFLFHEMVLDAFQ